MNEVSPCKDCQERCLGCHDRCAVYKDWRDRYHAQKQHLEDNRYRLNIPLSPARERKIRNYSRFGTSGRKFSQEVE